MSDNLVIGISDMKVSMAPNLLTTYALGSCVGICIYDGVRLIGGLAHILLPQSNDQSNIGNTMKYADTAIPYMIKSLERQGAMRSGMTAKIVGGAQMFAVSSPDSLLGHIGQRNVVAVKEVLQKEKIKLIAEDTGKNYGRTVIFDLSTGKVTVKSAVGKINMI